MKVTTAVSLVCTRARSEVESLLYTNHLTCQYNSEAEVLRYKCVRIPSLLYVIAGILVRMVRFAWEFWLIFIVEKAISLILQHPSISDFSMVHWAGQRILVGPAISSTICTTCWLFGKQCLTLLILFQHFVATVWTWRPYPLHCDSRSKA